MSSSEEIKSREYETTAVLSNAVQAGANVIRRVAGNDIADGFDGEQISGDELHATLTAKINSYLKNPTGGQQ
jgi:hypothetical protein